MVISFVRATNRLTYFYRQTSINLCFFKAIYGVHIRNAIFADDILIKNVCFKFKLLYISPSQFD